MGFNVDWSVILLINGTLIKELREKAGFSTRALAYRAGISKTKLNTAEHDNCELRAGDMKRLAEIFGVTVDELYVKTEV